jgi:hypothetical protein
LEAEVVFSMDKLLWTAVTVYSDAEDVLPLVDRDRLAVLSLWRRDRAPEGARFCDLKGKRVLADTAEVNWTGFPEQAAFEAADRWLREHPDRAR